MKKFIPILLATALLFGSVGCKSIIPVAADKAAPAIAVGQPQLWYGRVNTWAQDEKLLKADLDKMYKSGKYKGYLIEFAGWGQYAGNSPEWQAKTESAYKLLVTTCRKYGFWLHVSVANDNSGSGKYGDKSPVLEKQQALLNWSVATIMKYGPKNVVVQPVAETSRSWSLRWEAATGAKFKAAGFITCNNKGSRPSSKPSWATWNAWHPFHVGDSVPGNQLIITDTGPIIRELCAGLEGPMKPAAVQAYKNKMFAKGVPALGIYHFKYLGSDPNIVTIQSEVDSLDWIDVLAE